MYLESSFRVHLSSQSELDPMRSRQLFASEIVTLKVKRFIVVVINISVVIVLLTHVLYLTSFHNTVATAFRILVRWMLSENSCSSGRFGIIHEEGIARAKGGWPL